MFSFCPVFNSPFPSFSLSFPISLPLLLFFLPLITVLDLICSLLSPFHPFLSPSLQDVLPVVHYHFSDQSLTVYNFPAWACGQPAKLGSLRRPTNFSKSVCLSGSPATPCQQGVCVCVCVCSFSLALTLSHSVCVILHTVYLYYPVTKIIIRFCPITFYV